MRISRSPLLAVFACIALISACQPQQPATPAVTPAPPDVTQVWSSKASSQPQTSSSSSAPATVQTGTDVVGTNEATPTGVDSLEVPTTATGGSMTGRLTVGGTTILYGNAPSTSAEFNSPPVMLEFFDYNCEYCRQQAREQWDWLSDRYLATRRMNIERIYVPLTDAGKMMDQAALCAAAQGKYDEMDAYLMAYVPQTQAPILAQLKTMGINQKTFTACMQRKDLITDQNGVLADGTVIDRIPAFRIGGTSWIGILSLEELQKTIDGALKETYSR